MFSPDLLLLLLLGTSLQARLVLLELEVFGDNIESSQSCKGSIDLIFKKAGIGDRPR